MRPINLLLILQINIQRLSVKLGIRPYNLLITLQVNI